MCLYCYHQVRMYAHLLSLSASKGNSTHIRLCIDQRLILNITKVESRYLCHIKIILLFVGRTPNCAGFIPGSVPRDYS